MKRRYVRTISRALVFFYAVASANVQGATTDLSSIPLVTSSTSSVLPNLMFILDDSGSMDSTDMPDWASGATTSLFRNNEYNGVFYTPAVTYSPPTYFNADGSLNTTSYPSMTSAQTSGWTAVPYDGYGIQSSYTNDLTASGATRFHVFIPGEYCTSPNLRTCVTQSAPSVTHPYPAKVRWCNDTPLTDCQAVRIEEGTKLYTNARTAGGTNSTATITISGASNMVITGITVNGDQILSAATAASGTSSTVASSIVTNINACTSARTGNCDIEGFSASRSSAVVTITGSAGGFTPVVSVTGTGTAAVTTFSGGLPGQNIRTDIVSGVTYPFPGSSTKASTRTDCAGTTCTYAEEMTNFANWHAYYRTRMQMMKTGTGHAFKNISTNYRIGFDTINDSNQFLNISTFNASQKKAWYDKLYSTPTTSSTPLRRALSNIGRLYAGKLNGTTYHGSTVVDPMQYSCQQNFAILSTDGYWNGSAGQKIDGTSFGTLNPDGSDIRPYNDGATAVVTTVTPYTTTTTTQTIQPVKKVTPYTRTTVAVHPTTPTCTIAGTETLPPMTCTQDNGHYTDNSVTPSNSDKRMWCVMTGSGSGTECSSISGTGLFACRGSGNNTNLPASGGAGAGTNNRTCRTGSDGKTWCIYKGDSASNTGVTNCKVVTSGLDNPSNASTANRMHVCNPPSTPGATVTNYQITNQSTEVVQTRTRTTLEETAVVTNSTVITTNGIAAPATTSSGGTTVTTTEPAPTAYTPASVALTGSETWVTDSTSTAACSATAPSATGPTQGTTGAEINNGATVAATAYSTVGPVQGTPTTTSTSTGGVLDTLADVAQYYYSTDIRDASLSNCTGDPIPPATTGLNVCGSATTGDLNQRMVTFTLGLGASGQMLYSPTYATATSGDYFNVKAGTTADPDNGICIWQTSGSGACNWPAPASNSQKNIDDLWHAAVNGRGAYFSATTPSTLASGLASALAGVNAQLGSSAAATTSNPNVTSGDNFVFSTTFNTGVVDKGGWDGQLVRNQLDLVTGVVS